MNRILLLSLCIPLAAAVPQDDAPSKAEIERWVKQLGADFLDERKEALEKLQKAGAAAEEALIGNVGHEDYRVRRGCLTLLAKIGSRKAVKAAGRLFGEDPDRSVQEAAFAYLRACGTDAEDHLIAALERPEDSFRLGALEALKEIKSQKCAEMVAELYDNDPVEQIREQAFECLKEIGLPAKPFLVKLLSSREAEVRKGALEGLLALNQDDDVLLKAVARLFRTETSPEVQEEAYKYLRSRKKEAEDAFLEALESPSETVRNMAIAGLQEIDSQRALEPVAKLFKAEKSRVVQRSALDLLKRFGKRAEAPLVEALKVDDVEMRLLAIDGLAAIRSLAPLDQIAAIFKEDSDARVHRQAFDYLAAVGGPAEAHLILALKDTDQKIRAKAARTLGSMGSQEAIEPLVEILAASDPFLTDPAIDALARIGEPAVAAIRRAVADGRIKEAFADRVLGLHHRARIEGILSKLITSQGSSGYFDGQFEELRGLGVDKVAPVLIGMIDPDFQTRLEPPGRTTPGLYQRLMRELAVMALGDFGVRDALPKIRERLKEVVPSIGNDEYEELVVAAFKLGDESVFEEHVKELEKQIELDLQNDFRIYGRVFSLGLVQNRVGRREDALKTYLRMRAAVEKDNAQSDRRSSYEVCLYNIACLQSLTGKKEEALKTLEEAVRAGFRDREWVRIDKDLDAIRGEEKFGKLLGNEEIWKPLEGANP